METIIAQIEDILVFNQVALKMSFTRAADRLGLSRSQVSKSIQRLEAYYSTRLFFRTTRQISITESGAELFKASQKIVDLAHEASASIKELSQGESGKMRFTAPSHFGQYLFGSLVPILQKKLGKLSIEIDLSNNHRDLVEDGIDFAIRASSEIHPDLIARQMGRMRDVVCIAPALLARRRVDRSDPLALGDLPVIASSDPDWNAWRFHPRKGDEIVVHVSGKIQSNNYAMIREFCLQGHGAARIPLYMVEGDIRAKKLVALYEEFELSTHPVYLVYKRSPYYSLKHKKARDLMIDWFREHQRLFTGIGT